MMAQSKSRPEMGKQLSLEKQNIRFRIYVFLYQVEVKVKVY